MVENNSGSRSRLIIIILLVLILALTATIVYMALSKAGMADIKALFKPEDEYTLLLDEFTTNLYSESNKKSYLKVEMGIMYTEKGQKETLESNINKIRDIILENLRSKTGEQLIDIKDTNALKEEIKDSINDSLDESIVKDVYYTNLIVQ